MSSLLHDTNFLIFAAACALITVATLALFRISQKRARAKRFSGLELRPNCLLTRYPIVLLAKQKSLFRLFDQWNDVPKFLREHGYEVFMLTPIPGYELPSVLRAIEDVASKCHLIASVSDESLLESLARTRSPKIASMTLVKSKAAKNEAGKVSVDDLRPIDTAIETFEVASFHKSFQKSKEWEFEFQFLDHAVMLAERDARGIS